LKLNDWRTVKKLSYVQLALKLGASHAGVVRRWCLDPKHQYYTIPNQEFMRNIVNMTDGAVQPNDFYKIHE
tara:strand:+ start:508 stop:720 length:213 start_codon:yes stop_codon:yes gene_type:complete